MPHSTMLLGLLLHVRLPCAIAATLSLPYIPTSAFVNSTNASTIYVFEPNDDATTASLIAIDSSRSLTSNFAATTVSSSLPFFNTTNTAFTPFIDEGGNIYVLAGQCSKGAAASSLWTLKSGQDQETGSWNEASLKTSGFESGSLAGGINYLGAGHAFASTRNDTPSLYTFGGMCPNASTTSLSSSTWQSSANYSKVLVAASPSGILSSSSFASISSNQDTFNLAQSTARGGPVSEAGFSVTALQPSYSGRNGSTVQQNLVLIGGHTPQAFINMSQVALLSLPEQSWSFLPISSPSSLSGELVKKDTTTVEPRSGHTAVLSEDGTKIIVFGGWVGDINTPALPQLAILSVGSGYGGNGQWQWSVPTAQGSAPSGNGLYGHGAVMLPGNTMMIMGGNTISGQGSKRKRATTSQAYFLNVTSSKWTADYSNPSATPVSSSSDSAAAASHRGRSIGLGVGLGLGIPLFFIALCLLFCCLRRKHKRDKERQRVLDRAISSRDYIPNLQSEQTAYDPGQPAMVERQYEHSFGGHTYETESPEQNGADSVQPGWRNMRSMEAERTGLLVEIPSPTRGLRRSLNARGTSYYEDPRNSRRSAIHVINEDDEEYDHQDGDIGTASPQAGQAQEHERVISTADSASIRPMSSYQLPEIRPSPPMDPFVDPLGMHPVTTSGSVSPVTTSPNEDREREDRGWIEDWEALNTRISNENGRQQGGEPERRISAANRLSPDRVSPVSSSERRGSPNSSDRTTSTLSEKSMHSAVSFVSNISRHSGASLRRNPSQRSTHLFSTRPRTQGRAMRNSLPASGTVASAVATIQGTPPSQPRSGGRGQHIRNESGDSASGSPGQKRLPSFGTLQAESHALLGRTAATPPTHLGHTTNIEPEAAEWIDADEDDEFPQRPQQRRSYGLMGSVRSVLSRGRGRATSSSPTATASPTTVTFPGSSPSRSGTGTPFSLLQNVASEQEFSGTFLQYGPPPAAQSDHRRTGSSGSNLWRKRHSGAKDWDWRQGAMTAEASDTRRSGSDESKQRQSTSSPDRRTITESLRDDISGEWDVEGAIETRQVQVMFTVPRERLRVVNAAEGDAQSLLSRQDSTIGKGKEKEHLQPEPEAEADIGEQAQVLGDNEQLLRGNSGGKYKPGRGSPGLW